MTAGVRRPLRLVRQVWPTSFAGRLTLLLVLAFVLIQGAGLVVLLNDRRDLETIARVDQLVAVVTLFERTAPADRDLLVRALASRILAVALYDRRPALEPVLEPAAALEPVARALRRALPAGVELVEVGRAAGWGHGNDEHQGELLPSHRRVVVLTRLSDGRWLVVTSPLDLRPPFRPFRLLGGLGLMALVVLVVSRLIARRFARPLEELAAAADRLGTDVPGNPVQIRGSSELRRAAEAFNRMQARLARLVADRTLMLAAVAHDLKTALTRLRLRVELIDDDAQRDKAVRDLDVMAQMLDETLAFARDEAADEARDPTDLAALLHTLVDDASDAGHEAAYTGPDHLIARVRPVGLRRALTNLLDNALRYGRRARVRLDADADDVVILIDDDGPGIPEDLRDQVFRPFFRLDPSRARSTGGTGLGLAVARSIVRRHGGDVALASAPGGGLRVRVRLPA